MPLQRKRARSISSADCDSDDSVSKAAQSDGELDISSALTGKHPKRAAPAQNHDDDDDDDEDELAIFLKTSIAKRDVKEGTQVVKKAKGKGKITKGEVGGGSFQSMGLHPSLLRSLTLQGYRIPTPIQRLAIPALLETPPRDLVGMARTGSGKSLAYMVPLVQRLGGSHQTAFGARALILLPTRELAVQILKVGKELARGWYRGGGDHAGDKGGAESSKSQALRWGLVVGGEGLDEQFEMITNNPDIIIATPGRLLHLVVEMNLDLKSIQYIVFDEADRLFEMGFETALSELIHRLPPSRQSILFSATLPKSLVEFAKAGLQDPKLVRLDAESKISSDLKMAFFSVKKGEKEACLLTLLRDVIKVPLGKNTVQEDYKKSKHKGKQGSQFMAPHQTLIFAATKHHVEYLTNLLSTVGYAVSHIYGSLDQVARTHQMDQFRRGITSILVVTDVAARGIDIPVLENVVNFDFPHGARVFVHRVGRTARAGRQGWAWSFVANTELPYLLDLQLFLDRPLVNSVSGDSDHLYTENLVLGTFQREIIDEEIEYCRTLDTVNHSLSSLRDVMARGHALYERSKGKASPPSYVRAKEMIKDPKWLLAGSDSGVHSVLLRGSDEAGKRREEAEARLNLLRAINSFTPSETIFEATQKGNNENLTLMKQRRQSLNKSKARTQALAAAAAVDALADEGEEQQNPGGDEDVEMADEETIATVFNTGKKPNYRDEEFYISYTQKDANTEKGYSLKDGASPFARQAQNVTFDLEGDDGDGLRKRDNTLTWDKKKKKFIKGDGTGADNQKIIRTESGTKLPASYRSGRFDEWKAKAHASLPRIGEPEDVAGGRKLNNSRRFKHNKVTEAKPLDKLHKNYERRVQQNKMKEKGQAESGQDARPPQSSFGTNRGGKSKPAGRYAGKSYSKVKSEIKTVDQIRKDRKQLEQRKAKNARPSKGKSKGKGKGKGGRR